MSADTREERKAIVSGWIDQVFNRKDLSAVNELKFQSYIDWTPTPAQRSDLPVSGIKQMLPMFFEAFPDFHFTGQELIAEDDMVACLGTWHGTHEGELMGAPATGRRITGTRIDLFRISEDKMAEHWGCGTELGVLQSIGTLPTLQSPPQQQAGSAKEIASRFVEEVLNHRSLAAVEELVRDDAVDHSQRALTTMFLFTAFPDLDATVESVIQEDEKVTVLTTFKGTHRGTFMGASATDRSVTGEIIDIFRIVDGRIVESWQTLDYAGLLEQINA